MSGQAAPIGPWPRGLNTNNDIAAIADDELADVVNFDIDSSGTLISRPAIVFEADSPVDMTTVVLRNRAVNPSPQTSSAGWFAMDGTDLNDQHTSARTAVVGVSGYGWRATPVAAAAIEAENFEAGFGRPTGGDLRLTGTTELEYSIFAAVTPARSMRAAVTFYDAFGVIVGRLVGTPVALADDAALVRLAVVGTAPARALTASISAVGVAGGDDWDEDSWLTVDQVSTAPGDWFSGATNPPETAWLGPAYASISELRTEAEVLFATNFVLAPDPSLANFDCDTPDVDVDVVSDGPYGGPGFRLTMETDAEGPTVWAGGGGSTPVTEGVTYYPKMVAQLIAPDARPMIARLDIVDASGEGDPDYPPLESISQSIAVPPGEEIVISWGAVTMPTGAVGVRFWLISAEVGGGGSRTWSRTPGHLGWTAGYANVGGVGTAGIFFVQNNSPSHGGFISSDNGVTWDDLAPLPSGDVTPRIMATGGGRHVIVSSDGGKILWSSDGETWNEVDVAAQIGGTILYASGLAYGAGKFVADFYRSTSPNHRIATSPDGETWTLSADSFFTDGSTTIIDAGGGSGSTLAYGGGQFVLRANRYDGSVTTRSLLSVDGEDWTLPTSTTPGLSGELNYGLWYVGEQFVSIIGTGPYNFETSPDGDVWTLGAATPTDTFFGMIEQEGTYFLSCEDESVWSSPDLVAWTDPGLNVGSDTYSMAMVIAPSGAIHVAMRDILPDYDSVIYTLSPPPASGDPWLEGDELTLGRIAVLDSDVAPFSGSSVDAGGYGYAWTGVDNESTSTMSVIAVGSSLDMDLLGIYTREDGRVFLVVATTNATWLYDITTKTWQVIWNNAASGFVQYDNKVVLISEDVPGGYWEDGSFTATPTMPVGSQIVFYQARLWAFGVAGTPNANTVWFSNIDSISVTEDSNTVIWDWTTNADFFMVNPGDGETITSLRVTPSALIIFRSSSTWQFTFPTSPLQGTLRVLSQTVGADTKWAVVDYENYWFTFSKGTLYQFINAQFYPVSRGRVNFTPGSLPLGIAPQKELRLSRFGERIVIWYRGATYVYSASYNSFTTWLSPTSRAAHFLTVIPSVARGTNYVAYAVTGENDPSKKVLWRMENDPLVLSGGEAITAIMRTKAFDFTNAVEYKRLFFWTAEIASAIGATAYLHPVALSFAGTTWDELETRTWDQLDEANWDALMVASSAIVDEVNFPLPAAVRLMLKLIRAVRFQRIYFELHLVTDGTQATAPAKVYGITPYIGVKAITSRKVS